MYPILILLLGVLFATINPIDLHSDKSSGGLEPPKDISFRTSPKTLT